ncbi:MAG TPA: LPD29 domain-containing protein [Solirubrobacterales bacterium]
MATMETNRRNLTCAETAKLVRAALKESFPGQKFSVRSSTYAGGASIDVTWIDGPTQPAVNEVVKQFEGATFDAMIDLKDYKPPTLLANEDGTYEELSYGADWVQTDRRYSEGVEADAKARIEELAGVDGFDYNGRYDVDVDRETGDLFACTGQCLSETYGSSILHRYLYRKEF